MHPAWKAARRVAMALVMAALPVSAWAVFPEYQSQNSSTTFFHSAIMTSDFRAVWDFQFARLVNASLARGYAEIAFGFMQCFGGGMIDELTALNLVPAAYTSAARHDQLSWATSGDLRAGADPLYPDFVAFESSYNIHYGPVAGGAPGGRLPQNQRTAAGTAYNNDIVGQGAGALLLTNPQYTSSGPMGDGITLHNPNPVAPVPNPRYRAILFGGSTQLDGPAWDLHLATRALGGPMPVPANWESLSRVNNALLAASYLSNEFWAAYPGAAAGAFLFAVPPGNVIPVPAWVSSDTRAADLRAAFNWLAGQTNASTQIFYWNSFGHGARAFDFIGWLASKAQKLLSGVPFTFTLDPTFTSQLVTFYDELNPGGGSSSVPGSPDLKITTTIAATYTVALDGQPLSVSSSDTGDIWGDGTEYQYAFSLSSANISDLAGGGSHTLTVTLTSGPPNALTGIELLGFTTGDVPPDLQNGVYGGSAPPPPAPVTK
jgi:hypothetical protein